MIEAYRALDNAWIRAVREERNQPSLQDEMRRIMRETSMTAAKCKADMDGYLNGD